MVGSTSVRCHLAVAKCLAVLTALLLATVLIATGAHADTKTKKDPQKDSNEYGGQYSRADDITKFRASYTRQNIVLTVWMRKLARNGADMYFGVLSEGYRGYRVVIEAKPKLKTSFFWYADDNGDKQPCKGLDVTWNQKQGSVTAKIPMSCTERLIKRLWLSAQVIHGDSHDDIGMYVKRG